MKKPGEANKGKRAAVSFGQCLVYEYDKDSASTTAAKKVDSKDISDMRDEKTKIRDMLQAKENEEVLKIQKLREMMNTSAGAQDEKDKSAPSPDKFKSSAAKAEKMEESIQESQSLSQSKGRDRPTESYDTDTFEEQSASQSKSLSEGGSGAKKQGINYWPGKQAYERDSASASASQSKEQTSGKDQVLSATAMEEYMKQKAKAKGSEAGKATSSATAAKKPVQATKDFSESSDKYTDDDFDSMSKSQGALASLPKAAKPSGLPLSQGSRIASTYVRKANVFTQTETGKYSFMSVEEGAYGGTKDWTMKRNLEDAELLIQEQRNNTADAKEEILQLEQKMKKLEMDYRTTKREALSANETNKRLREQLDAKVHAVNMFQIETEALIKQVDMADAKTREKEDELRLMDAEYDKKMQLQVERILLRRNKTEERGTYELKREHQIEVDELKSELLEKKEEIDYLKSKVDKLDAENTSLRQGKGDNKKLRELENEVGFLKMQLDEAQKNGGQVAAQALSAAKGGHAFKKELSPEEQRQLQREVQQLDSILKGYQEENVKAMDRQRDLDHQIKELTAKREADQRQLKEYQLKALKKKSGVYVEDEAEEVNMQAQNVMGSGQAISQKQLAELHEKLKELQRQADNAKSDLSVQANQFRSQIQRLRDDKQEAEKQLYEAEFAVGGKDKEIEALRDEKSALIQNHEDKAKELEDRLAFFRENQRLLSEGADEEKSNFRELQDLKQQLVKAKEDKKRLAELEKKCRLLEETTKNKNPNSIGMLIQAAKADAVTEEQSESKRELQS